MPNLLIMLSGLIFEELNIFYNMTNIQKLYKDIWNGSLIPMYLTLMTQDPLGDTYLTSETIIWRDRALLNKMYEEYPEVRELPFAKRLRWDCICQTRKQHMQDMVEIGIQKVFETYDTKNEIFCLN